MFSYIHLVLYISPKEIEVRIGIYLNAGQKNGQATNPDFTNYSKRYLELNKCASKGKVG